VQVCVGTSGWQYRDWRDNFYPTKLAQREWLAHYADAFGCVEVNNTFYNLPREEAVQRWYEQTPADFAFILKASRYLTHIRRLRDPAEPVRLMMERFAPLRRKLVAMLVQLPPTMPVDVERLDATLAQFPSHVRVAVEFRHESWFNDEVRSVLRRRHAALCLTDRKAASAEPEWLDLSWLYLRLHEGDGRPYPCYARSTLDHWADRISDHRDGLSCAYVFFNNDGRCCAPRDAAAFARACSARGLDVMRTPPPELIHPR
jgi:uncharacterized protein YecE (DUF72 family)